MAKPLKPLAECRLYAFVDTTYLRGRSAEAVAQQLCDGGADLVQLRAKHLPRDEVCRLAERLLSITAGAGVGLVINDHVSVARAVGAPLCHLGQEDFFGQGYAHITQLTSAGGEAEPSSLTQSGLRSRLMIGLSTHAPAEAERTVAAGADYVAIGPVYPTGTKPAAKPVTLDYVRWAAAHLSVPWFAIGGINLVNLDEVLAAGARRVAVVSAILDAPAIARACQEFRNRLGSVAL